MATPLPATLIVRKGEVIVPLHRLPITRLQERILWSLAAQVRSGGQQKPVPIEELIDICYGDKADGGPLYADKIVHNRICHLNKVLPAIGWEITRDGFNGYMLQETPCHPMKPRT